MFSLRLATIKMPNMKKPVSGLPPKEIGGGQRIKLLFR
jgi:hypothetical protein